MADLRPLTGLALIETRNRDAWADLVHTWGTRAVVAACTACGAPALLPDVQMTLKSRFAPEPTPAPEPAMPESAPSPADLLTQLRAHAAGLGRGAPARIAAATGLMGHQVRDMLAKGRIPAKHEASITTYLAAPAAPAPAPASAATPAAKAKAHRAPYGIRTTPPDAARKAVAAAAAALGVRPVPVYCIQGNRLVEALAIPIGAA